MVYNKKDKTVATTKEGIDSSLAKLSAKATFDALTKAGNVNLDYLHYNELDPPPKEYIKTDIPALNKMLGGGIPVGKIGEYFGSEGSSKTTLAYHNAVAFQKAGGYVIYIDTEHAFDFDRFVQIGGDIETLLYLEADTLEQIFTTLITLLTQQQKTANPVPTLLLIDTVTGAPLAEEMAAVMSGKDISNMQAMKRAMYMSIQLRQLPRLVGASRCSVIFINQVRIKMNAQPFQDPYEVPGGKAIKFYASYRIKVSAVGKIKSGEDLIGQQVKIETIKVKTAAPQKHTLHLIYETGMFDNLVNIITAMKDLKWIRNTRGGTKVSNEFLLGLGFKESYEDESAFRAELEKFNIDDIQKHLTDVPSSGEKLEEGADARNKTEEEVQA